MPETSKEQVRRYWWVNQNQTYAEEIGGGFMWRNMPKLDRRIPYEKPRETGTIQ